MKTRNEILIIAEKFIGMRTILEVPFDSKEDAKSKGAKWNPELRKWYTEDFEGLSGYFKYDENSNTTANFKTRLKYFLKDQNIEIIDWRRFITEAFTSEQLQTILENVNSDDNDYLCKDFQSFNQIFDKFVSYL